MRWAWPVFCSPLFHRKGTLEVWNHKYPSSSATSKLPSVRLLKQKTHSLGWHFLIRSSCLQNNSENPRKLMVWPHYHGLYLPAVKLEESGTSHLIRSMVSEEKLSFGFLSGEFVLHSLSNFVCKYFGIKLLIVIYMYHISGISVLEFISHLNKATLSVGHVKISCCPLTWSQKFLLCAQR